RMSGVVSSTSPRRRSVITRMRGRSGRSRLVIGLSGGADFFGQAFARSLDIGMTYTTSPQKGAIPNLVIVSIARGHQDRHQEYHGRTPRGVHVFRSAFAASAARNIIPPVRPTPNT